jgi:hypothetical protein
MKQTLRENGLSTFTPVRLAVLLGWATFPSSYINNPLDDGASQACLLYFQFEIALISFLLTLSPFNLAGVVILYSRYARDSFTYNEGDTLTHEVGHWLGLYLSGWLQRLGDQVGDTPPKGACVWVPGGPRLVFEEAGLDPINNFMDYSDDAVSSLI